MKIEIEVSEKNEGSANPWWAIITPKQNMALDVYTAAGQITGPYHSKVAFVEKHLHPLETVTIIERWVPAKEGERSDAYLVNWEEGHIPMRLEGRYLNGKRI